MTSPRYLFGGGVSDFAIKPPSRHGDFVVSAPDLSNGTLWSAPTDGVRYADLQTVNGGAISTVSTDGEGTLVPFLGPPGIDGAWLDFGAGSRAFISASEGQDAHIAELIGDPSSQTATALADFTGGGGGPVGDIDPAVADVVNDGTSATRAALDGLYTSKGTLDIDVVAMGAAIDGVTDDTAAWQAALDAAAAAGGGRIFASRSGVSIIGGALQDPTGANSQLKLPSVDYVDAEQIAVVIEGPIPPPPTFSVIGPTPLPDGQLVLKSTLTAGSGGNMIGAQGPVGTYQSFTNLHLRIENVTFRMPANTTHTALDFSKVGSVDLDNVIVDASSYDMAGLTQPTTATSYGIRLPKINNGAFTRLGSVYVLGFYTGIQFNEHTNAQQVTLGGCVRGAEFTAAYHASKFERLMAIHCQKGIVATGGAHYVDIDQYDIEHIGTGWNATTADVDDPSNYLVGTARWHVVLANSGIDATFTKNGGTSFNCYRVGTKNGTGLTVQDENGTIATGVTQIDFQGAGIAATAGSGEVVVTVPGGSSLTVQDENTNVATGVTQIDFQGAGVSVSAGTGEVIVTIPGGGTGGSMAYASYTPTFGAATTNPTLGTGGSRVGRYAQNGKFTTGSIFISTGTSGFNQGSGALRFGLPAAANMTDTFAILGIAYWTTGGGAAVKTGFLTRLNTSEAQIIGSDGAAFGAGAATLTNGDVIMIQFNYEAAGSV